MREIGTWRIITNLQYVKKKTCYNHHTGYPCHHFYPDISTAAWVVYNSLVLKDWVLFNICCQNVKNMCSGTNEARWVLAISINLRLWNISIELSLLSIQERSSDPNHRWRNIYNGKERPCIQLAVPLYYTGCEIMWVEVKMRGSKPILICAYFKP